MNLITLHKTYRAQPKRQAKIYIGGVDATKYADAQGFSDYFRANYDPTNPVVVPVGNIKSYITDPDGNGRLNIAAEIEGEFEVPSKVFSNISSSESGSRITYIINEQKIITGLNGIRNFANNPLQFILLDKLQSVAQQWINSPPRVLDLEGLIDLGFLHFTNFRNGSDRINIRNATNFLDDPANDLVFNNYNLNGNADAKKVIYVHSSMTTINNGSPFASLQTAINRGADVRYVSDTTTIPPNITDLSIAEIGATYIKFAFTDVSSADFYEVFRNNYQNVIEQFFPLQEVTNGYKYLTGLDPNTTYNLQLFTRDVNYNQSDGSNIVVAQTIDNDLITIAELSTGGIYVEFSISNLTPYTINQVEVYVNGILNTNFYNELSNPVIYNLAKQTNYNIHIVAKTDEEIDLTSNTITATTTTTPSVYQNAVAYYKLDETSGDAIDVINGHNISFFGNFVQGSTRVINKAIRFINGRGELPISIYNNFNNDNYTVSFWFKTFDNTKTQIIISDYDGSDFTKRKLFVAINGNNQRIRFGFGDNGNNQFIDSNTTIANNTKYFVQLKYKINGQATLRVNNVTESTYTFINAPQNQNPIWIGLRKDGGGTTKFPLDGIIDEMSFINGQTSANVDSDLYNNGNGTTI